jgi:dinuclear metal center YbgI/SA1388 family protein
VAHLDGELDTASFSDASHNGLQVENSGRIRKVCCGVDASMAFFEAARERGANLLVCHHGLSWGDSLSRITGLNYRRLVFLLQHDMALYASHLPLDAHPRMGNNAVLCKHLGLTGLKPFGMYRGRAIGFAGRLPKAVSRERLRAKIEKVCARAVTELGFGPERIRRVGVVSGGGCDAIPEAAQAGIDLLLTGEGSLWAYNMARDMSLNVMLAGHYATEGFGVRALGEALARRFRVKAEFIDMATPF